MKIQEQFINIAKGTTYWKVYFEFINEKQLTTLQWELINNMIKKMIDDNIGAEQYYKETYGGKDL